MPVSEGKEIPDEDVNKETSQLTRQQAGAVKKRIDTLNATLRKKHKQQARGDVRDVFSASEVGRTFRNLQWEMGSVDTFKSMLCKKHAGLVYLSEKYTLKSII